MESEAEDTKTYEKMVRRCGTVRGEGIVIAPLGLKETIDCGLLLSVDNMFVIYACTNAFEINRSQALTIKAL